MRGSVTELSAAARLGQPEVIPNLAPGNIVLSDTADTERVVRVWTNENTWYSSTFNDADISDLRAFVYISESTDGATLVTSVPLRPRGVSFGVRPGQVTVGVAVWNLNGSPVATLGAKVSASISDGRPQLHPVGWQSIGPGQTLWWEPDKFDGSFNNNALTRAGCRFCDAVRVAWISNDTTGFAPPLRITRGQGGTPLVVDTAALWGQVDLTVDRIIQVQVTGSNTYASVTPLVYR